MAESILFWVLGIGALLSALAVIVPPFGRHPVHAAIALIAHFLCLAALYVLLSAHVLAVLQVLVYAGAIMVLFLFVIMLLNLRRHELGAARVTVTKAVGVLAGGFVLVKIVRVLALGGERIGEQARPVYEGFGGIRDVGEHLYTSLLAPFELVSILLLVAVVGAVVLAKKRL